MKQILGNVILASEMATTRTSEVVQHKPAWCTKRMTKGLRRSETPGKTKGETCQTDPQKKFFLCHPHAYKHPQYGVWCDKVYMWVYGKKRSTSTVSATE